MRPRSTLLRRCPMSDSRRTAPGGRKGGSGRPRRGGGGESERLWGVGAAYKNPSTGGGREQRGRSLLHPHPLPQCTDPRPRGWAAALHPPLSSPSSPPPLTPSPYFSPFIFRVGGTFPFGSLDLGGGGFPEPPFFFNFKWEGYRSGPAVGDLG